MGVVAAAGGRSWRDKEKESHKKRKKKREKKRKKKKAWTSLSNLGKMRPAVGL